MAVGKNTHTQMQEQLAVLDADLAILDEIDSGLDVDALKDVAAAVNALRSPSKSVLLITHYQRLLDFVQVEFQALGCETM